MNAYDLLDITHIRRRKYFWSFLFLFFTYLRWVSDLVFFGSFFFFLVVEWDFSKEKGTNRARTLWKRSMGQVRHIQIDYRDICPWGPGTEVIWGCSDEVLGGISEAAVKRLDRERKAMYPLWRLARCTNLVGTRFQILENNWLILNAAYSTYNFGEHLHQTQNR